MGGWRKGGLRRENWGGKSAMAVGGIDAPDNDVNKLISVLEIRELREFRH